MPTILRRPLCHAAREEIPGRARDQPPSAHLHAVDADAVVVAVVDLSEPETNLLAGELADVGGDAKPIGLQRITDLGPEDLEQDVPIPDGTKPRLRLHDVHAELL